LLFFSGEIEHQPQDRGIADFVSRYDDVRIRRWAWRSCGRLRLDRGTGSVGEMRRGKGEKRGKSEKGLEAYRDVIIVPPWEVQVGGTEYRVHTRSRKSGYDW
jgi:hypothetical protein